MNVFLWVTNNNNCSYFNILLDLESLLFSSLLGVRNWKTRTGTNRSSKFIFFDYPETTGWMIESSSSSSAVAMGHADTLVCNYYSWRSKKSETQNPQVCCEWEWKLWTSFFCPLVVRSQSICISPHLDAMSAGCLVLRCPSDSRSSHTPIIKQNVNVLDFLPLDVCSRYVSTLWLNIWHSPEELQRNPKEVNFTWELL